MYALQRSCKLFHNYAMILVHFFMLQGYKGLVVGGGGERGVGVEWNIIYNVHVAGNFQGRTFLQISRK